MGFGDGGMPGCFAEALGARYLGTSVRPLCAPWLGFLPSHRFLGVPPGLERQSR